MKKEVKDALEILANSDFETIDKLRSILHSASIRKGYTQPSLVKSELDKLDNVVKSELEVQIYFKNVEIPKNYSQNSYKVDLYFETEKEILLIDPKGSGHNNNTPISDEVQKWVLSKEEISILNKEKKVRFILLKPDDVNSYEFERLKKSYSQYGIELFITDDFLSEMRGERVNVSDLLKENKHKLMSKGIRSIIS